MYIINFRVSGLGHFGIIDVEAEAIEKPATLLVLDRSPNTYMLPDNGIPGSIGKQAEGRRKLSVRGGGTKADGKGNEISRRSSMPCNSFDWWQSRVDNCVNNPAIYRHEEHSLCCNQHTIHTISIKITTI